MSSKCSNKTSKRNFRSRSIRPMYVTWWFSRKCSIAPPRLWKNRRVQVTTMTSNLNIRPESNVKTWMFKSMKSMIMLMNRNMKRRTATFMCKLSENMLRQERKSQKSKKNWIKGLKSNTQTLQSNGARGKPWLIMMEQLRSLPKSAHPRCNCWRRPSMQLEPKNRSSQLSKQKRRRIKRNRLMIITTILLNRPKSSIRTNLWRSR